MSKNLDARLRQGLTLAVACMTQGMMVLDVMIVPAARCCPT
jgi:hypothetical protein